ncbi:MAG: DNA starvation/stationary phase protection protein [Candidatus Peribacteria bacterium]|nr:MAG: DNA starvation/stationary phase protection protein [Candidatus Peribacteria bacterium]
MKANIGIQDTSKIVDILATTLATENILNLKIRNYHWNVESLSFNDHHKFFEGLYDESNENIDAIAERIRMLGEKTPANYETYLRLSIINEEK